MYLQPFSLLHHSHPLVFLSLIEFERLNPLHFVSVLADGDVVVSDSFEILLNLEEKYPKHDVLPVDPYRKPVNLQAASIVICSIQPMLQLLLMKNLYCYGDTSLHLQILDWVLGPNDALFRRAQLKAGSLSTTKSEAIGRILACGHSRVPVYSGNPKNTIGLLLVKSLFTVRAETETPVSAVSIRRTPRVSADILLYDMLKDFHKGSSHMAVVVKSKRSSKISGDGEKPNESKLFTGDLKFTAHLPKQDEE